MSLPVSATSPENSPTSPRAESAAPVLSRTANYYTKGNSPRRWQDYLLYPRVLFTLILCFVALVLHIAFGIYVWFYE